MISYCIAAYRPTYTRLLVDDLLRKTSLPCEVLVWLNVVDPGLEAFLQERIGEGRPVRIVGRSPENRGMQAYRDLFLAARHPLMVQIDDDVVCVSPGIAERAVHLFARFPRLRQIVADVWQDDLTTGARPPLAGYRCVDRDEGLYDGPIDGWFSIYHRSILPVLLALPYQQYCCLGGLVRQRLRRQGLTGLLCTRMKVFHVIGPAYASHFGMFDFEVEKYRRLGRGEIVQWYEGARAELPPAAELAERVSGIERTLTHAGPW